MTSAGPIDLYQLDIFLQVASTGSMSAAARTLKLSQSAVSQAVAQLEKSFGLQLIDRTHRPLALTAAGLFVSENGEKLVTQARAFRAQAVDVMQHGTTNLRIGIIDSVANTAGVVLIKKLMEQTTSLSVQIGMAYSMEEALKRREIDLVITTNGFVDSTDFDQKLLYHERFIGIVQKQPGVDLKKVALAHLCRTQSFIRFSRTSALGTRIERILKQLSLDPPRKLEVDHADTLTLLVTQGLGWAITTPTCLLQTSPDLIESLDIFPLGNNVDKRNIYLVGRSGEFPSLSKQIARIVTDEISGLLSHNSALKKCLPTNCVFLEDSP